MNGNPVKTWQRAGLPREDASGRLGHGLPRHRDALAYGDYNRLVQLSWCDNSPIRSDTRSGATALRTTRPTAAWGIRGHHDYQREGNSAGYYTPAQNAIVDGYAAKNWILIHREPTNERFDASNVSDIPLAG